MTDADVVIIGSGPAGWCAAIYTSRARLKTILLTGEEPGGQLTLTNQVENYPGFENGILGPELMKKMRDQAQRVGTEIIDHPALAVKRNPEQISVAYGTPKNQQYFNARSVIIATGARANTLGLKGEDKFVGRGIGTCAVCDAPLYKDRQQVFVVGGGDSAIEEALALSKYVRNVTLVVRKSYLKASKILQERIKIAQNIEIWFESYLEEVGGAQRLEQVGINRNGNSITVNTDGLFYAIGHSPNTSFLIDSGVLLNSKGYIITNLSLSIDNKRNQELHPKFPNDLTSTTTVSGIFAAGDCVDSIYRQAITAAGFGCMAGLDAQKWLEQ